MNNNRQMLAGLLRTTVDHIQKNSDERYARQLASLMERYALILRSEFGGKPKWATGRATVRKVTSEE